MKYKKFLNYILKIVIQLVLFVFFFSSLACSMVSIGDTRYSSFTSFLMSRREINNIAFNYGQVTSDNYQNYSNFYWYADDVPGSNLRGGMHTYFKVYKDDLSLYSFTKNNNTIECETLLFTTWDFKKFHYGFEILSNQDYPSLKNGEVYITESFVTKLFSISKQDYNTILDQTIDCGLFSLTVKGIIMDSSLGYFNTTVGDTFVLGNYNYKPFATNKMIYEFIMFGSEINTFADVICIEGTIAALNSEKNVFKSTYYDFNESFLIGDSQRVKEATIDGFKRNTIFIVFSLFVFFLSVLLNFLYLFLPFKKLAKIRLAFKKPFIHKIVDFYTLLVSLLICLMVLHLIGIIKVGYLVVNCFDFSVVTSLFFGWIIGSAVIILIDYFRNKKNFQTNSYSELGI